MIKKLIFLLILIETIWAQIGRIIDIPNQGQIEGVELSKVRIQKIIAYYGIPYAQPPMDNLRFAAPVTVPLPSWTEVRKKTDYPPSCMQPGGTGYKDYELAFLNLLSDVPVPSNISEDCLYLNVFVPNATPPKQGFPTIIWFHPGNFTTGLPPIWNPHTLVYRQRVIVVTFSWRLNIFGFFTTMDKEASGNFGLMDQQAAMLWVNNNIKLFGGDPDNISLMGYGAGAISIGIHMINHESRLLFHKVIAMSGSVFQSSAVRYPDEYQPVIDGLARDFLCSRTPTSLLLACLRKIDANLLIDQISRVAFTWRPIIDKGLTNNSQPFLEELPKVFFENDDFIKIPILTGYTNMELGLELEEFDNDTTYTQESLAQLLTSLVADDLSINNSSEESYCKMYDHVKETAMFFYAPAVPSYDADTLRTISANVLVEKNYASPTVRLANYLSKSQPTYMYRFDMRPSSKIANRNLPAWIKMPHLYDLIYVWGLPYWKTDQREWDPRDKGISDTVMAFWTAFAKHSDPTKNTIYPIRWEMYTKEKPGVLILDNNIFMSDPKTMNYKAFEFWNEYYPKVLEMAETCCGLNLANVLTVMVQLIVGLQIIVLL